ncbi:MAG: PH domain-containing protein [Microbacterium arborescens]
MTKTYRPVSATIAVVGTGLLGLFLLGDAVVRTGVASALMIAPWVLLAVWVIYTLLYASHISVDDEAVVVANPLRVTRVPWPEVTDIRMRWQVTVDTRDGHSIAAFGGPSPSRPARPIRAARLSTTPETERTPAAVRDVAEIRDLWQQHVDDTASRPIERTWNRAVLLPLAVIALSAVVVSVIDAL